MKIKMARLSSSPAPPRYMAYNTTTYTYACICVHIVFRKKIDCLHKSVCEHKTMTNHYHGHHDTILKHGN